ncbi:hypothetical protein C2G38_2152900 [Gigaspora rosea]|uniref:Uncharacterized protein n=1 Tax=Gigaspora rosea TaxID=44941 RepID=A0A397W9Y6_9GLOM|nr:hypothetical protein C2G38_2152900 [Gigaspora rosea]
MSFFKIWRFSLQIAVALFYSNSNVTHSILTRIIKINELKDKEENEFEMTKTHNLTKETENKLKEKFYTANALKELKEGIDDWLKD